MEIHQNPSRYRDQSVSASIGAQVVEFLRKAGLLDQIEAAIEESKT